MSAPSLFDQYIPDAPRDVVQLAAQLALKAGPAGITVDDLRVVGAQKDLMPNVGFKRELSYLGGVMKAAGLVPVKGAMRRSILPHAHGNWRRVWVAPQYAERVA